MASSGFAEGGLRVVSACEPCESRGCAAHLPPQSTDRLCRGKVEAASSHLGVCLPQLLGQFCDAEAYGDPHRRRR